MSFERVLREYPGTTSSDTALLWTASLSVQTDPIRSVAAFEQLVRKRKTRWEIDAMRIAVAETLFATHTATDRERAYAELAKVSPTDPDGLFFIAQHRLAELAWLAGDRRAARRRLERARAGVTSDIRRRAIEQNLAYMVGR